MHLLITIHRLPITTHFAYVTKIHYLVYQVFFNSHWCRHSQLWVYLYSPAASETVYNALMRRYVTMAQYTRPLSNVPLPVGDLDPRWLL